MRFVVASSGIWNKSYKKQKSSKACEASYEADQAFSYS